MQRFRAIGAHDAVVDVDFGRHLVHVRLPAGEVPPPATQRVVMQTAELRFRPVLYNPGGEPLIFPFSARPTGPAGSTGFPGCEALLEKSPPDNDSARDVVLPDRERKYCYVLGPAAVTGAGIGTSGTVYDSTQSQWVVLVSFKNNDFLDKVAGPYVGKQIAIELDGVVQSAPTVQPGIMGRDVQITGQFTKSEAEDLAHVLRYGALPVQLHFVSAAAAG